MNAPNVKATESDRRTARLKNHVSAPGMLKFPVPPLLEKRRLQFNIVDEAFEQVCVYERVYIHQVSRHQGETMGDGVIVMADVTSAREREQAPMGVVVSAGLGALDAMHSNGIGLGHLVSIARLSPWRVPIKTVQGVDENLLICEAGDIIASFDLAEMIRDRTVRIVTREDPETKVKTHVFIDDKGQPWTPKNPWPSNG